MNTIKIIIMLAALSGILVIIGALLGGARIGLMIALLLSVGMNFGSYSYSDSIVLKMYNAQPVTEEKAPLLYKTVRNMTGKASMPIAEGLYYPG